MLFTFGSSLLIRGLPLIFFSNTLQQGQYTEEMTATTSAMENLEHRLSDMTESLQRIKLVFFRLWRNQFDISFSTLLTTSFIVNDQLLSTGVIYGFSNVFHDLNGIFLQILLD